MAAATATGNVKLLVFVLGAPGAGKGTQCERIKEKYGWDHISAGDLLRAEVTQKTPRGLEIEEHIKQGTMVPGSWIIALLRDAMAKDGVSKVLIDGFPREVQQLLDFQEEVMHCNQALFFNVPEEVARQRLQLRSATSGRVDDNDETIRNRFLVFRQESMPVIEKLAEMGRVAEIDASGAPDDVFAATSTVIEQLEQQLQQAQEAAPAAAAAAEASTAISEAAAAELAAVQPSVAETAAAEEAAVAPSAEASEAAAPAAELAADGAAAAEEAAHTATGAAAAEPAAAGQLAGVAAATGAVAAAGVVAAAAVGAAGTDASPQDAEAADTAVLAAPVLATAEDAAIPAAAAVVDPVSVAPNVSSLQMDLSGIRMPIVICGPSGVGKGTLISKLMAAHPDRFGFSVSHTTRAPRPGEAHGVHYYFTSAAAMAPQVEAGMFLEHAAVHGNMYGTSLAAVARVSAEGKHCVLDIDVQGAQQVRRSALGERCLFVFIAPPSHEELERRLRNRGTEAEDKVRQRLANAESEIAKAQEPGLFHHILVNGDLEAAFAQLQHLIQQRVPGLLPELSSAPHDTQPQAAAEQTADANGTAGAAVAAGVAAATGMAAVGAAAAGQPAELAGAPLANGNGTQLPAPAVPSAPTATVVVGGGLGTSALLDFGFGAAAGPAVAVKGMPVRQYMDVTVIPVLREGLKALNVARPDDPLQYLADYLVAHKPAAAL